VSQELSTTKDKQKGMYFSIDRSRCTFTDNSVPQTQPMQVKAARFKQRPRKRILFQQGKLPVTKLRANQQ